MKNYFCSVDDMPLYNWRKCQEKEEIKYTRIDIGSGSEENDLKAWELIYDSYLKEFGLGKDYERVLELKSEIALLELDLVIEEDKFIKNNIKRLQRELQEILKKPVESDMDSIIIYLEKWIGFRLDEKNTTVRKFYKLLRQYKKEADNRK